VIAYTIACAVACGALVFAEWRGLAQLRILAKLAASAAFVAAGACALVEHPVLPAAQLHYARALLAGLVLGAAGDACLLGAGKRWFLAGLTAFLLGHLAYLIGIAAIEPPARWLADAGWRAAVPLGAGLATLVLLWQRLRALRLPVVAYVAVICAMTIAALAAGRGGALPALGRSCLAAGAVAFFVSDLAVARSRFVADSFVNRLWGLPAYYTGQLLIAWSIAAL
jgi:uncharacterized membrane protein YhhN